MSPCRVCGNAEKTKVNRHHLLPKMDRKPGARQITIRLCAEKHGCMNHFLFHEGEKDAAMKIRSILDEWEVQWIIEQVGEEWLQTIYPAERKE